MKNILILIILTIYIINYSYSQSVTTVTIGVSEDSFTDSGNPSFVNYTALTNSVYVDASLNYYRSFYKFNLSSIPANSVIVSAILRLRPSGTENIAAVNSNQLYLDACNTAWSQTTLNHSSGISNNFFLPTVTESNLVGLNREFKLTEHVQAMVDGRIPNSGWRLRRNPENTTSLVTRYVSKEGINSSSRPQLEIKYYQPAYVSAATIVHATSGSSNGSVSPTILQGASATRFYQWYNASGAIAGATNLNLTGKPYGWYGLKSWDTIPGDTLFQAFLIGSKCEMVDIYFNPGADYIDNSSLMDAIAGSGTTITNYNQNNIANYNRIAAEQMNILGLWYNLSSLVRFKLWVDPTLEIIEAKTTLYGSAHYPLQRSNASTLTQVASAWKETGVSAVIRPTLGTLSIAMPGMPSGNGNSIIELKDFFNSWKTDNLANHGMDLSLQSYLNPVVVGSTITSLSYESANNTNKPNIAFKVSWVQNGCDFNSYSRFKPVLDASFVRTIQGQLKIQFNEDYDQKAGRFTKLVLYDVNNNQIKAGINYNGTQIGPFLLPAKLLEFDYNQHVLNLTPYSLITGNTYVLELTNSVGEKSYIKFKYYN